VAPPTATPQVIVIAPGADARTDSGSPNTNYGASTFLRLRTGTPSNRSYLKFVVSGVSGQVQSATLRLYVYDGGDDGGGAYTVSNSWTETGITWNNAPAISGSPLDTVGSVSSGQWVEYDVTAAVSGNGTFSFGLKNASADSVSSNSREASSNKPELVLVVGGS
jgi:hypothetical protein